MVWCDKLSSAVIHLLERTLLEHLHASCDLDSFFLIMKFLSWSLCICMCSQCVCVCVCGIHVPPSPPPPPFCIPFMWFTFHVVHHQTLTQPGDEHKQGNSKDSFLHT